MNADVLGPIRDVFSDKADVMRRNALSARMITPETVFQEANVPNRELIHEMLDQLLLPGSGVVGADHLADLYERSLAGAPCLILMEHYSNFDIPCLYYLLGAMGRRDIADAIVAIAGMKLSEESAFVNAFAEAYTRIVIYPSRSLSRIPDPDLLAQERVRANHINMAATRTMIRVKHHGSIILVFPAGTRYREGQPDTKRGVKEVDSYLKSFETMVLIASAGSVLRIDPAGDMSRDLAARDVVILNVSPPIDCVAFRERARAATPAGVDSKQNAADAVMAGLERLHREALALRSRAL